MGGWDVPPVLTGGRKGRDLFHAKSRYMFDVSPPGHGFDCFRTWEALALGMIPIVLGGTNLDATLFAELPVVRVANFTEITVTNLRRWARKYAHHHHYLTMNWLGNPSGQRRPILRLKSSRQGQLVQSRCHRS